MRSWSRPVLFGAVAVAVVVVSALSAPPARADGNVNVVVGPRYLDDGSWSPVDHQTAYGVMVDFGRRWAPVNFAIGLSRGTAEDTSDRPSPVGRLHVTSTIDELQVGVARAWEVGNAVRPFVGGGVSWVTADSKASIEGLGSTHDSSSAPGLWIDFGVYWRLAGRFNLGVDARILTGSTVKLFGFDRNADYRQFGALFGWGWPRPR
jgi:hypothetical protein